MDKKLWDSLVGPGELLSAEFEIRTRESIGVPAISEHQQSGSFLCLSCESQSPWCLILSELTRLYVTCEFQAVSVESVMMEPLLRSYSTNRPRQGHGLVAVEENQEQPFPVSLLWGREAKERIIEYRL